MKIDYSKITTFGIYRRYGMIRESCQIFIDQAIDK